MSKHSLLLLICYEGFDVSIFLTGYYSPIPVPLYFLWPWNGTILGGFRRIRSLNSCCKKLEPNPELSQLAKSWSILGQDFFSFKSFNSIWFIVRCESCGIYLFLYGLHGFFLRHFLLTPHTFFYFYFYFFIIFIIQVSLICIIGRVVWNLWIILFILSMLSTWLLVWLSVMLLNSWLVFIYNS